MAPCRIVSLVGFVLVIIGIFCPLISPLGLVRWNLLDLNQTFGLILNAVATSGVIFTFKKQPANLYKLNAWIAFGLVVFIFIAVVMKVHTAFSFIPFPKIANTLSGFIHYRWGWYLLFAGSVLALLGTGKRKSIHTSGK